MEEKRKEREPLRKFSKDEMRIVRETDLPDLLAHLGYQVKRVGNYHTTAEMDSLRIKERRTWIRYSSKQHGDAITFLQEFQGMKFPEAVNYCWPGTDMPETLPPYTRLRVPQEPHGRSNGHSVCRLPVKISTECSRICANGALTNR